MIGRGQGPRDGGLLDEALTSMATCAPEFGPGLSNHGPMAAEALVTLGRGGEVARYLERYRRRLEPGPEQGRPLPTGAWERSLGLIGRYPEWVATFERELAERSPPEVLATWVPRLAPGSIAAAGHGLLRTAHATRALGADGAEVAPGSPRSGELARGLAYWAARYQELPGPPVLVGPAPVADALAGLPALPEEAPTESLITDQVRHLDMVATPFEQAVAALAPPEDLTAALDALALGGARAGLADAEGDHGIALVHAVTVPLALELVLPSLDPADRPAAFAYCWQAAAALHSAYARNREPAGGRSPGAGARHEPGALVDAAVESGDEHAIKLTEACLRAHARTGQPALLAAAARFTGEVTR